ncbi:hypothetical protein J2736_001366 [Paenibacillus qinlingensis]|uniref:Holin-like toxin n=1 Tax=Paenibacillus qinlingensis TaxID=1837343 RepID=A0ABU1NRZ0_9BACL|nr:hypothetical protein [Paenibacillus qinlingensis]
MHFEWSTAIIQLFLVAVVVLFVFLIITFVRKKKL